MVIGVVRVVVVAGCAAVGVALAPGLGLAPLAGAAVGAAVGGLAVTLEVAAARLPVEPLFWSGVGGAAGLVAGLAIGAALGPLAGDAGPAVRALAALVGAYLGGAMATRRRGDLTGVSALLFGAAPAGRQRIVDTSVIIDGRIADVCDAGFVEGVLVVPRFVLRELQQIADAPDPLKRNRGKRGLEVLGRLQQSPRVTVEVAEVDFPDIREVDLKLVELARTRRGATLITNDHNLARVAELSGVEVLSLNELANALKPVVLPGEGLRVQVLREGREAGQGVAFLEDGTMVVVDQGRRFVGQAVDVTVTSVLQTAAGRMIFTRLRGEDVAAGGRGG